MKTLSDKIQESIIDPDKEVIANSSKQIARQWMSLAAKAYQNDCEEGKDYSIDDEGKIQIYGTCTSLVITDKSPSLKRLNPYVKIISLEPSSRCTVSIIDADAAMNILPISQWGKGGFMSITAEYSTKQNMQPKHFPMLIHGNLRIREAGNIDFSIMPNCTGEININTRKCGTIKWPAGFPSSAKEIKIQR